ncbi:MAG: D-alanyl-D-alanine carboxypeptidase/D-alanyl-D-alanine-endopeptidase [Bacteroidota bacterium]
MHYNFLVLWLLLALPAGAQTTLQDRIRAFAQDPELAGALVAVNVVEVSSGKQVGAHQAVLNCIPASTQKLITTAAAMDLLGADHHFRTQLIITGTVNEDGVLTGDVYIIGGGDPSLGSPYLEGVPGLSTVLDHWCDRIKAAGIKRINGRIIGDGSYFGSDAIAPGWPWSDIGNYYGSGAYGLNLHENFYFLDFLQRGKIGAVPLIQRTRPIVPDLKLSNELRSGPRGSGDQAYIYGAPFGYDNYVRGTIPIGTGRFTIKGAIPDPPLFAAQALCRHLEAAGISVQQPAATDRELGSGRTVPGRVIDTYESPPLAALVDRTNLRSLNLYAEALLRELNKSQGREHHALASTKVITDWLQRQGLSTKSIQLEDGSGLATRNFFSAAFMTAFLRTQASAKRWRKSIPLAGRTGSMRGFLKGTVAEGKLWAKSGSLGGARAYAGYALRPDGSEVAFAIMVNNFTLESKDLRKKMHRLMQSLCL